MFPDSTRLAWSDLIGKVILVGVTVNDHEDRFLRREQHHGRVVFADDRKGILISLEGSEAGGTFQLPPDIRSIQKAPPGQYRLHSTGEVLADPDFLTTWVRKQPPPDWKPPVGGQS